MPELNFEFDWVDSEGIRGSELAATWASLTIAADKSVITRVLDTKAKTVRDFVHVPLYPLAEWMVTNWWFLANECENPTREHDPEFRRRHTLSYGREGYAYPNIQMTPSGTQTRLRWEPGSSQWTGMEFLHQGQVWTDSQQIRHVCAELIDSVIRRLMAFGITGTLLEEEWEAIQTADEEEIKFCETAGGLGWDPYDLDDSRRDDLIALAHELGDLLDEAVQALGTAALRSQSSAIVSAIEEARDRRLPLERLMPLGERLRVEVVRGRSPWNVGYDWARRLRRQLSLDGKALPTMNMLADALGESAVLLDDATQPVNSLTNTPLVDGVVAHDDQGVSFALRPAGGRGRRFSFCRALAEVLSSHGADSLVTRARSERQQRNRAFAAEFLAPSSTLRQMVSGTVVDDGEVDDLADEFGVSPSVIWRQLENHQIARVAGPDDPP